jgi:hypothetical protein
MSFIFTLRGEPVTGWATSQHLDVPSSEAERNTGAVARTGPKNLT